MDICRGRTLALVSLMLLISSLYLLPGPAEAEENFPEGSYMTEKGGFLHIQVSGSPMEVGYQHGVLLADLIPRSLSAYGHATERSYGYSWTEVRLHGRTYWRYVPQEQREEIEGIAEGSSQNGALNPNGDPVDYIDIVSLNAIWDIWWRSSPPGNPWWWIPWNSNADMINGSMPHHCSAFVATGDATEDGGFVMGQSLWMPYFLSPAHAVFIDIIPDNGNRISMEVTAGMIWSGTEWYQNSAGLVVSETTLGSGPYIWGGVPSFVRLRKAIQYADSIDSFKDIMLENTNGAYCGDYLIADVKTNEVAILELGAYEWELARTMNGFLPSCNYPWDPEVAREMGESQDASHGCYPRWVRWHQIEERDYGNITVFSGMEYLGDHYDTVEEKINPCSHTLCGHVENASGYPHGSLDGKVTNRTLAMRNENWARFGHSCGQPFIVADHRKEHPEYSFDDLVDIIPRPYVTFGPLSPLRITVVDRDGNPLSTVKVVLTSNEDGSRYNLTTGADGVASSDHIQHSDYMISGTFSNMEGNTRYIHNGDGSIELRLREREDPGGLLSSPASLPIVILLLFVAVGVTLFLWKTGRLRSFFGSSGPT